MVRNGLREQKPNGMGHAQVQKVEWSQNKGRASHPENSEREPAIV